MEFWDWVVSIWITGMVFTGALLMWLGRDRRGTHEDEHVTQHMPERRGRGE